MLSIKENFLMAAVEHKTPEWIPNFMAETIYVGGMYETFENGPFGGGLDGFGVTWHATQSAGGQPVPGGPPVLDDITKWEDIIRFPDLDAYDWEGNIAAQLAVPGADRDIKPVDYGCWNAQFMRITHVMGFENALIAMIEEPEACDAFFAAVTDYKIGIVERVAKYLKPDFFTNYDDIATERGLFMSPETYRKLLKPHHKRLNDAIRAYGMHPNIHTCGKCEEIIPDYVEIGTVCWESAQPMNDIVGIQKKYGDKITVVGGYNTNGIPGRPEATDEQIETEVKRCMETYAPNPGFIFMGFRLVDSFDPMAFFEGLMPINAAVDKYSKVFLPAVSSD